MPTFSRSILQTFRAKKTREKLIEKQSAKLLYTVLYTNSNSTFTYFNMYRVKECEITSIGEDTSQENEREWNMGHMKNKGRNICKHIHYQCKFVYLNIYIERERDP